MNNYLQMKRVVIYFCNLQMYSIKIHLEQTHFGNRVLSSVTILNF